MEAELGQEVRQAEGVSSVTLLVLLIALPLLRSVAPALIQLDPSGAAAAARHAPASQLRAHDLPSAPVGCTRLAAWRIVGGGVLPESDSLVASTAAGCRIRQPRARARSRQY
jgi:hypothetical protein